MFFSTIFLFCEQQSCFVSMRATLSFGADVASAEKTTAEWTTHVRRFLYFFFIFLRRKDDRGMDDQCV